MLFKWHQDFSFVSYIPNILSSSSLLWAYPIFVMSEKAHTHRGMDLEKNHSWFQVICLPGKKNHQTKPQVIEIIPEFLAQRNSDSFFP